MNVTFFRPAVRAWFDQSFAAPTPAQTDAWPAIAAGRNVLIAAPTDSGKTLAAVLCAIDGLIRQGLDGGLTDETQIVYVSPLKALSNDIHPSRRAAGRYSQGTARPRRPRCRYSLLGAHRRSRLSRKPPEAMRHRSRQTWEPT
jgi:ATP-dependent Lhr-like helicase